MLTNYKVCFTLQWRQQLSVEGKLNCCANKSKSKTFELEHACLCHMQRLTYHQGNNITWKYDQRDKIHWTKAYFMISTTLALWNTTKGME